MKIYKLIIIYIALVLVGCQGESEYYKKVDDINNKIDNSIALYDKERYASVIKELSGTAVDINELKSDFPSKNDELMPDFQLAIIYALKAQSYKYLQDSPKSESNIYLFNESIANLDIHSLELNPESFLERITSKTQRTGTQ